MLGCALCMELGHNLIGSLVLPSLLGAFKAEVGHSRRRYSFYCGRYLAMYGAEWTFLVLRDETFGFLRSTGIFGLGRHLCLSEHWSFADHHLEPLVLVLHLDAHTCWLHDLSSNPTLPKLPTGTLDVKKNLATKPGDV